MGGDGREKGKRVIMLKQILICNCCQEEIKYSSIGINACHCFEDDKHVCDDCFVQLRGRLFGLGLRDLAEALNARSARRNVNAVLGIA